MPTALSHPAVPLALGFGLGRSTISGRLLAAGVAASVLPDVDVIAFRFGIPYSAEMGHRGFTHSLAFAALVSLIGVAGHRRLHARPLTAFSFLLAATASHGILDAFTDGGLGVAFLWPFSPMRYFAPFRRIHVAPLSLSRLLSGRGVAVLLSEMLAVWLPCGVLGTALAVARMRKRRCALGGATR